MPRANHLEIERNRADAPSQELQNSQQWIRRPPMQEGLRALSIPEHLNPYPGESPVDNALRYHPAEEACGQSPVAEGEVLVLDQIPPSHGVIVYSQKDLLEYAAPLLFGQPAGDHIFRKSYFRGRSAGPEPGVKLLHCADQVFGKRLNHQHGVRLILVEAANAVSSRRFHASMRWTHSPIHSECSIVVTAASQTSSSPHASPSPYSIRSYPATAEVYPRCDGNQSITTHEYTLGTPMRKIGISASCIES